MVGKLIMRQEGNTFNIYSPQGIQLAQLYLGEIRDYNKDRQCLFEIGKALAKRWGITTRKK